MTSVKTRRWIHIKVGLEAHHLMTHMNAVTLIGQVLVGVVMIGITEVVTMKEEVQDLMVIMEEVLPVQINDRRRDDRSGNGKKSEDGRVGNGGIKVEGTSLDFQSDLDSCSPMVRPVRDILGENVSPLRVIEPSLKANGGKSADPSLHTQV